MSSRVEKRHFHAMPGVSYTAGLSAPNGILLVPDAGPDADPPSHGRPEGTRRLHPNSVNSRPLALGSSLFRRMHLAGTMQSEKPRMDANAHELREWRSPLSERGHAPFGEPGVAAGPKTDFPFPLASIRVHSRFK